MQVGALAICLYLAVPLVLELLTAVVIVAPLSRSVTASSVALDPTHVLSVYSPPPVVVS